MRRFTSLSSTTSAERPPRADLTGGDASVAHRRTRTEKPKVLPSPGALSRVIAPPMSDTRRAQMVSPSPVPPYSRVVELSACEKASNTRWCFSRGMPMPVSRTDTTRDASSPSAAVMRALRVTSPRWVNLTALERRLSATCRSRPGSPRARRGSVGARSRMSCSPFSCARVATVFAAAVSTSAGENSTASMSRRPASIFEKSRMSLMICSSEPAAPCT